MHLLLVGCGGFMGAILRYLFTFIPCATFPLATLLVNGIGSMALGILLPLFSSSPKLSLLFCTGMLGAFTTFSAFSYETFQLISGGKYLIGILNIFANLMVSILFVMVGHYLSTHLLIDA